MDESLHQQLTTVADELEAQARACGCVDVLEFQLYIIRLEASQAAFYGNVRAAGRVLRKAADLRSSIGAFATGTDGAAAARHPVAY